MKKLRKSDEVLCHAYDLHPHELGLDSCVWTPEQCRDFEDTAREVVCSLEEFHTSEPIVNVVDKETGQSIGVRRDSLVIVNKDLVEKGNLILADIDGVLTNFNHEDCSTELTDGSFSQYTNLLDSVRAKPTYVFSIIDAIANHAAIGLLTARGETQRIPTEMFLRHNIEHGYLLFMRGFGTNSISAESLKVRMIQSCILPYFNIVCFIEDTEKNVQKVNRILPHIKTMLVKH